MKIAKKKIDCGKCLGRGHIEAYRGIAGGVCFACAGSGHRLVAMDYAPGRKFICVYAGQELFTKTARNEEDALRKAIAHWSINRTAPAFVGVTQDQIAVREV